MKRVIRILITVIVLCFGLSASAQTASTYLVPDPETAKWSYVEMDANGKTVATQYHSVESLVGNGINGSMKVRVKSVSASSPSETEEDFLFYLFKDGECMFDMKAVFESEFLEDLIGSAIKEENADVTDEQVETAIAKIRSEFVISGEVRGIPRYPKAGELPDYEFLFKFSVVSMKVTGEDRRIIGTEKVVTNAGTFDCFILEETITTKAMMMKEVEKIRTWYSYGIGVVKEITYGKNGKVASTMVLNSKNW